MVMLLGVSVVNEVRLTALMPALLVAVAATVYVLL